MTTVPFFMTYLLCGFAKRTNSKQKPGRRAYGPGAIPTKCVGDVSRGPTPAPLCGMRGGTKTDAALRRGVADRAARAPGWRVRQRPPVGSLRWEEGATAASR